jgi:hypothetical protein
MPASDLSPIRIAPTTSMASATLYSAIEGVDMSGAGTFFSRLCQFPPNYTLTMQLLYGSVYAVDYSQPTVPSSATKPLYYAQTQGLR